jgi:hypothetical protein
MRPLTVLLLYLCLIPSWSMLAAQNSQSQKAEAKPLTNGDVLDMLNAGVSQDIVVAKIKKSPCEFDTSPAALKALRAANAPDAVVLAMVEASSASSPASASPSEIGIPARVNCSYIDPVPVFSAPRTQSDSVETFKVKCGDRMTILGPINNESWTKVRSSDGQIGYISSAVLSKEPSAEPEKQATDSQRNADKKREEIQRAADDYDDCRTRAQNQYDTKMNVVNTLTLTPVQRVYASSRLKQNFDAEVRNCRTRYESRLKIIEAK